MVRARDFSGRKESRVCIVAMLGFEIWMVAVCFYILHMMYMHATVYYINKIVIPWQSASEKFRPMSMETIGEGLQSSFFG